MNRDVCPLLENTNTGVPILCRVEDPVFLVKGSNHGPGEESLREVWKGDRQRLEPPSAQQADPPGHDYNEVCLSRMRVQL